MTVTAPGEMVRPGEPILQIVPADSGLVVMARLKATEVGPVIPGQEVVRRSPLSPPANGPNFTGTWCGSQQTWCTTARQDFSGRRRNSARIGQPRPKGPSKRRFGSLLVTLGVPVEAYIRAWERSVTRYLTKPGVRSMIAVLLLLFGPSKAEQLQSLSLLRTLGHRRRENPG